ncbi:hypothetical protein Esti_001944 [Eimeria stiedai]
MEPLPSPSPAATLDSPSTVGPPADDAFGSNEAVLCAVCAKSQGGGGGLSVRLGIAIFDPRRSALQVAEIDSDAHLTSLEGVLLQVGAVSVLAPSGDSAPWLRRLPYVVHAVNAELLEGPKSIFSATHLLQDLSFLLPAAALKPAAARELRLEVACTSLAALISYWSLAADETLCHACELDIYGVTSFLHVDAAAAAALNLLPQQQQQQRLQPRILPCSSKYGEAHAAAKDRLSAAAAAAAAAAAGVTAGSISVYSLFARHCCTSLGSRRLHLVISQPLVDEEAIVKRHDLVKALMQEVFRRDVFQLHFKHVTDLDRVAAKLHRVHAAAAAAEEGRCAFREISPQRINVSLEDLVKLYDSVVECNSLLGPLGAYDGPGASTVRTELYEKLHAVVSSFSPFVQLVEHSIDMEEAKKGLFIISTRFDVRMKEALNKRRDLFSKLQQERAAAEGTLQLAKRRDGDAVKLVEDPSLGFALRVVKKDSQAVLSRKKEFQQVRLNKAELLFTSHRLKLLAAQHREVCEEYQELQKALVEKSIQVASTYWPLAEQLADFLGLLDVLGAFAAVASTAPTPYVQPVLCEEGGELRLEGCRHALLEVQGSHASSVIANDCFMDPKTSRLHLLTGPNMGGKSTFIRQVALCVLLAQIGSFVPCKSCVMPVFKQIMCRVGASDLQLRGVSTFLAEMVEASAILRTAGPQSLVVVDELGRGTSTYEGFGLAWAIAKDLAERSRSFTLFATHFLELAALEGCVEGVRNYHVKAATCQESRKITFLYEVQQGHADQSYGVHVARLAGLPESITRRAAAMSQQLEAAEKREKRKSKGMLEDGDVESEEAIKRLRRLVTQVFSVDTPEEFAETAEKTEFELRGCLNELQKKLPQIAAA